MKKERLLKSLLFILESKYELFNYQFKTKFSPILIDGPSVRVVAFLEYRFYSNGKVST